MFLFLENRSHMPFPLHQYVLGVSVLWIHFYDFETILGRAAMVYHRPASQEGKISNISHKSRIVLLDCSRWSCLANMVVHSNFTMYYFYSNCIETFFFFVGATRVHKTETKSIYKGFFGWRFNGHYSKDHMPTSADCTCAYKCNWLCMELVSCVQMRTVHFTLGREGWEG